jgi:peptide/nickel transport system permease protein
VQTVIRRILQLAVVLIVVTFFTSLLTSFLPDDPVTTIAPFATGEDRKQIEEQLGLDQNVVQRYVSWLGNFVTGDMGREYAGTGVRGQSISETIKDRLPRTLLIIFYVQLLTLAIAIPLGVYTAYKAGKRVDDAANGVAFLLLSLPVFVISSLMIAAFSVNKWVLDLPTGDWVSFGTSPTEHFKHLIMPVIALTVGQVAIYTRLLRSDMIATLQEDFILMAKSKGISNRRILWHHALRPSSLTLLTVAGLNIGSLISGALIVEVIFRLNGIGSAVNDAINRRQYVALQDYVAIIAILFVLINFAIDALYRILDPRIRGARLG